VREASNVSADEDPTSDDGMIEVLRPGETFGFGGMTYRERPGAERVDLEVGPPREVLTEAEFDERYAYLGDDEPPTLADLVTVEDIQLGYGPRNEPVVTFTATSERGMEGSAPTAYAVFRNDAGQVIGGAELQVAARTARADDRHHCGPGREAAGRAGGHSGGSSRGPGFLLWAGADPAAAQ
jgi:hypothetical protein